MTLATLTRLLRRRRPAPVSSAPTFEVEQVACDLCNGTETVPVCEKYGLNVVACRSCGLVYVNPRPTEASALRRYSPAYFDNEYLPHVRGNMAEVTAHFAFVLREVNTLLQPRTDRVRLLELGCGSGTLLNAAASQLGWQVSGVEFNSAAVDHARRHYRLKDVPDILRGSRGDPRGRELQFVRIRALAPTSIPIPHAASVRSYCRCPGSIQNR